VLSDAPAAPGTAYCFALLYQDIAQRLFHPHHPADHIGSKKKTGAALAAPKEPINREVLRPRDDLLNG
jgi:hypothetical protein